MMKKLAAAPLALLISMVGFVSPAAAANDGSSAENPLVVLDTSDVPADAVEDAVSTYSTDSQCDTTRSWVSTLAGTEAITHSEARYQRVVDAVDGVANHQYFRVVEHPYIPQVTHTEMTYRRKVITQERQSAVGEQKDWVKDTTWYIEGEQPYAEPEWRICLERYIYDDDGQNTYVKEYLWHHYIVVIPAQPAQKEEWQWQYSDVIIDDATPPSADLPLPEGGLRAPNGWSRNGNRTVIDVPAVAAWSETIYYTGEPDGTTDPDMAAWVSEAPAGDWTQGDEVTYEPAPVEGYTEYYVEGGEPSLDIDDASWVSGEAPEGFTVFESQTIIDEPATDPVVTYYAWSDGVECNVPGPAEPEPEAPQTPEVPPVEQSPGVPSVEPTPDAPPVEEDANPTVPVAPGASTEALPATGTSSGVYVALGLLLLLTGGTLQLLVRRRQAA